MTLMKNFGFRVKNAFENSLYNYFLIFIHNNFFRLKTALSGLQISQRVSFLKQIIVFFL